MKTIIKQVQGFKMHVREGSTDESAIKRCITEKCWFRTRAGFIPQPGERWLELGANIGAFTVNASAHGAHVTAYEPVPENAALLRANIAVNNYKDRATVNEAAVTWSGEAVPFYIPSSERNHYRCSVFSQRDWQRVDVKFTRFESIDLDSFDGIKMDMEGAEIEILEKVKTWGRVKKLAFAYHFKNDPSVPRFNAILGRLRNSFKVTAPTMRGEIFRGFPDDKHVFCQKP
jgi:FkbM family methyltransferase